MPCKVLKIDLINVDLLQKKAKTEALSFLENLVQIPTSANFTGSLQRNLEETGKGTLQV